MEILESAKLADLIVGYIRSNWSASAHSLVNAAAEGGAGAAVRDESFSACLQLLRSEGLRGQEQEVLDAASRAVAVASSARRFLAGFKALFICSAAEMLERLAGPGSDLDKFVRVFSLAAARTAAMEEDDMDVDRDAATEDDMDVDGRPAPGARHRQEGSGRSCASAGSVAALLPSPGAKRKRACGGGEVDTVHPPQKRRLLAWTRPHQRLRSGFGRVSSAPRRPPPAALPRSRPARTVALAYSRFRRRIGRPPTTTRHRPQPSLGQHFSRIRL